MSEKELDTTSQTGSGAGADTTSQAGKEKTSNSAVSDFGALATSFNWKVPKFVEESETMEFPLTTPFTVGEGPGGKPLKWKLSIYKSTDVDTDDAVYGLFMSKEDEEAEAGMTPVDFGVKLANEDGSFHLSEWEGDSTPSGFDLIKVLGWTKCAVFKKKYAMAMANKDGDLDIQIAVVITSHNPVLN